MFIHIYIWFEVVLSSIYDFMVFLGDITVSSNISSKSPFWFPQRPLWKPPPPPSQETAQQIRLARLEN